MTRICYEEKNFKRSSLVVIDQANEIIAEYLKDGYKLTLRQLYYQFVSRDLIPNTMKSYKRLGSIVSDGRIAGLIDWEAIEDRTRSLRGYTHWDSPEEIVRNCKYSYRRDKWEDQAARIEIWVEKEALAGIFSRIAGKFDVDYFCCKGYTSQSEMWSAAQRLAGYVEGGRHVVILHFGDHDPSGIDMTRDIRDRMGLFGAALDVKRLALNMDQVEEHQPPPNPAKMTDSRFDGYVSRFGRESWELDALDPRTLEAVARAEIDKHRDMEKWRATKLRQEKEREMLERIAREWDDLEKLVSSNEAWNLARMALQDAELLD